MISTYPAFFSGSPKEGYSVVFPDLNHFATQGNDYQEAICMAVDFLAGYIDTLKRDRQAIPVPSSAKDLTPDPDETVVLISVDVDDYARKHFNKAVKKTLSIPRWLNEAAIKKGLNFSRILQNALKDELGIPK